MKHEKLLNNTSTERQILASVIVSFRVRRIELRQHLSVSSQIYTPAQRSSKLFKFSR